MSQPGRAAFTLTELLIVAAILALLVAVRLPVLCSTKQKVASVTCVNNHRQLVMAWRQYVEDNREVLLFASGTSPLVAPGVWMSGEMDFSDSNQSNWDPAVDIYRSPLWPYCGKAAGLFKCPADMSFVKPGGVVKPRVRSVSMNLYLGGFSGSAIVFNPANFILYKKFSDLNVPGPSQVLVFLDQREDSINLGNFYIDMTGYPASPTQYEMQDWPGGLHNNGAGLSFADGRCEIKRWLDIRTCPPIRKGSSMFGVTYLPNDVDIGWLQDHATRPVN